MTCAQAAASLMLNLQLTLDGSWLADELQEKPGGPEEICQVGGVGLKQLWPTTEHVLQLHPEHSPGSQLSYRCCRMDVCAWQGNTLEPDSAAGGLQEFSRCWCS